MRAKRLVIKEFKINNLPLVGWKGLKNEI